MSAIEYEIKGSGDDEVNFDDLHKPSDMDNLRPLPRISIHSFCESEVMLRVMERLGSDRRMGKVSLRITNGDIAAAAGMFSSSPTPNLIILETKCDPSRLMDELSPLAEFCDPSTRVVIVSH